MLRVRQVITRSEWLAAAQEGAERKVPLGHANPTLNGIRNCIPCNYGVRVVGDYDADCKTQRRRSKRLPKLGQGLGLRLGKRC